MKIIPKLIPILLLSLLCTSLKRKEATQNIVKLTENLYVSVTEVSNIEYRTFLNDLLAKDLLDRYAICIYDSSKWQILPDADAVTEYYHRHAVYNDYPVVNISQQAMEYYCEWLTLKYEEKQEKKYKNVVFRLPSTQEYKLMIGTFPDKVYEANVAKKASSANNENSSSGEAKPADITAPVFAYQPNRIGLYNLIGNVSEVSAEGKIIGGNFTNYLEDCSIEKSQQYTLPDVRVGFRYVMEIKEF